MSRAPPRRRSPTPSATSPAPSRCGSTSTSRIARTLVSVQYDRLGIDYLNQRDALINGVSLADTRRVARRLLDPAALFTVVVGQPEGIAGEEINVNKPASGN